MREFWILFKHEMNMQFSSRSQKGVKRDVLGTALSLLTTLLVAVVFIVLVSSVVENYVGVKVHLVSAPFERGLEMLNAFYIVILLTVAFTCMEKMRNTLTQRKERELFLRLPVKPQTLLMSKLCTLLVWTYAFSLFLIVTVNLIFYLVLKPAFSFWVYTFLVWLLLPMSAFLIAVLLLVPYIKLIEFISEKYWLIFVLLSAIVIGAFVLYSGLLGVLQALMEKGTIKYLFNEEFILTLQGLLKWGYPANFFASIIFEKNVAVSITVAAILALVALVTVYFVSRALFHATLYKNAPARRAGVEKTKCRKTGPLSALIRKEFISVFREPKHLFSYFSIAAAMPVMVYCCYTLFQSLIDNAIGIEVDFALALLVLLIFSILTNTFCATNITRDGLTALKSKMFPVRPFTLLLAKVLFCAIVSSLAVIASAVVLAVAGLPLTETLICGGVAWMFSLAQIFIATRMDLNHARVSASLAESEAINNRTVAKVVFLGLLLALVMGVLAMFISILARMPELDFVVQLHLQAWYAYLVPAAGSTLYLLFGIAYYVKGLEKSFERLIA